MAEYLLHSMSHFDEIIEKLLLELQPSVIVEVGSEYAGSTEKLAAFATANKSMLYVIDPAPKIDPDTVLEKFRGSYEFIRAKSTDALPKLKGDIFFLDGDHNYWTVHSELSALYANNPSAWVVLHDIGFPWARRDLYYAPEEIPAQHCNPYSYDHGVDLATDETCLRAGFWGAGDFAIAMESGTPRNGVLTAVEDFLVNQPELHYDSIPLIFGLGVIVPKAYANFVSEILRPYQGPLCEALERNRLELYGQLLQSNALKQHHRRTAVRRWANKIMDKLHL